MALEKGFTSEHPPSLCTKNSQLSMEPKQKASSGAGILIIFPSGMLRKVPLRRVSHGSGEGRGCSRALERHGRHTALSRTRSAREGSRRRTSPKSSGWTSGQNEDRASFFIIETASLTRNSTRLKVNKRQALLLTMCNKHEHLCSESITVYYYSTRQHAVSDSRILDNWSAGILLDSCSNSIVPCSTCRIPSKFLHPKWALLNAYYSSHPKLLVVLAFLDV